MMENEEEFIFENYGEYFDEEDSDEEDLQLRAPNRFHQRIDYNKPSEFRQRFRITPRQADLLLQSLGAKLDCILSKNHAISSKQKLLISLRFYASNDYYYSIGDSMGVSHTAVMIIIKKTTQAILDTFLEGMNWPSTEYECRRIAAQFSSLAKPYGMPLVAGALDGTLIDIVSPKDSGGVYFGKNRRSCLNVLGVTDGRNRFLFLSARFPGAVHDQRVLRKTLGRRFEEGFRPYPNAILLGDSGYKATDWLIPMKDMARTQTEKLFYAAHAGTRWTIETLWGIFKNRFICTKGWKGHGPLRFRNPAISSAVIMACGCLQNWIVDNRLPEENDDGEYIEILPNEPAEAAQEIDEEENGAEHLRKQINFFREFNQLN